MIAIDHVTLTFPDGEGRVRALDNVSLAVDRGRTLGITGPSGSGKSSLLAVASTLIHPDSGTVVIDDVDVSELSQAERSRIRRDRIGIVFQQSNLIPSLTAVEQLVVMGELGSSHVPSRADRRTKAMELLDAVGIAAHARKRPAALSGGQRQRVNIARALMNDPGLLVVDEPTSALDQERGAAILDLILRLTAEHETATLLVTHDRGLLSRLESVRTIVDGRISGERPWAEFAESAEPASPAGS